MKDMKLEDQIERVAALREPVRQALYLYVAGQGQPVGRDDAALALGIARGLAAFHLDKLAAEGLLAVEYRRLSERRGPGAGRPNKLYRRADRQIDLTLPQREYELAARLLAGVLAQASAPETVAALHNAAFDYGVGLGMRAAQSAGANAKLDALLDAARQVLATHGFEPFSDAEGVVRLRNCPFDALTQGCRELVCGMNLAIIGGVLRGAGLEDIEARLDPRPGLCCVACAPAREA